VIHASGLQKSRIEAAMVARSADTYADFLLPHLQPDMIVLDLGCGQATISIGLSETVPNGRVVGVDIDRYDLAVGRRNAAAMDRGNLAFAAGGYLSASTFSKRCSVTQSSKRGAAPPASSLSCCVSSGAAAS
jgi:predicted RNA methylase